MHPYIVEQQMADSPVLTGGGDEGEASEKNLAAAVGAPSCGSFMHLHLGIDAEKAGAPPPGELGIHHLVVGLRNPGPLIGPDKV